MERDEVLTMKEQLDKNQRMLSFRLNEMDNLRHENEELQRMVNLYERE